MTLEDALNACGLIAILRGIAPAETVGVGQALFDAGIRIVEVPLNSPDPFTSIAALQKALGDRMVVGAGTVLSVQDVNMLAEHGGRISVSPNANATVIKRARDLGIEPLPGVFTPTEAFAAIEAGTRHLKLFPAEVSSPAAIKAWKAVLPAHIHIHAVGGINASNMAEWLACGVTGFGIGSNLYKPGKAIADISKTAREFVSAYKTARGH